MTLHSRKKVSISLLVPFMVFVLFFSSMIWQKYRESQDVPVTPSQQQTEGQRSITLFFAQEGTRLAREARQAEPCENDDICLKSVIEDLINGPVGALDKTIPDGTTVNSASINGNLAVIDFNQAFADAMLSGSLAEMVAVYSVVNSVAANFPLVEMVHLTVDGNQRTILRHLDLSEPLLPDFTLESRPKDEPEKSRIKPGSKSGGAL